MKSKAENRAYPTLQLARDVQKHLETYRQNTGQLAEKLGRSESWLAQLLSFLKLPPEILEQAEKQEAGYRELQAIKSATFAKKSATPATNQTTGAIRQDLAATRSGNSATKRYSDATDATETATGATKPATPATDQTTKEFWGGTGIPKVLVSVAGLLELA